MGKTEKRGVSERERERETHIIALGAADEHFPVLMEDLSLRLALAQQPLALEHLLGAPQLKKKRKWINKCASAK
jgi:hypothetical protein